jgi:hypothetical protein
MNEIPSSFQLNIFFGEQRGWGPSEKKEKTSVSKYIGAKLERRI